LRESCPYQEKICKKMFTIGDIGPAISHPTYGVFSGPVLQCWASLSDNNAHLDSANHLIAPANWWHKIVANTNMRATAYSEMVHNC